ALANPPHLPTRALPISDEVPLDDELDLVRQYVAIEQARFSDRLRPSFDIPDAVRHAAVPSFAVQHLVENAIRHGIAKQTDGGRVDRKSTRLNSSHCPIS